MGPKRWSDPFVLSMMHCSMVMGASLEPWQVYAAVQMLLALAAVGSLIYWSRREAKEAKAPQAEVKP